MDMVMFTGQVTHEELRSERPAEYERMARAGTLETLSAPPAPGWPSLAGRIVGGAAVVLGLVLLVLILVGTL